MAVRIGERLSIEDVVAVAKGAPAELSADAARRMRASLAVVEQKVAAGETVYGVTTGLGSLANVRLQPEEVRRLQHDLLRSHAVGVGPPLSEWETRAMLCTVANSRSYGGGMKIAPDARIDDGLFDLCVLGEAGRIEFLMAFPRVFRGTHTTHPKVSRVRWVHPATWRRWPISRCR